MKQVGIEVDKYEVLGRRAKDKGFDNAEEYIRYLLDQIVDKIETEEDEGDRDYTEGHEEQVKSKLENLGYMN